VLARPDDPAPGWEKMEWLEPKWHGSVEELVAFGRELRDGADWSALRPMLLVDAHLRAAESMRAPGGEAADAMTVYFKGNPAAWREIKALMDEYLRRTKEPSKYHMTRYALIAGWAGEQAEMDATIARGSGWHARMMGFVTTYNQYRREAAARARDGGGAKKPAAD